MNDPNRLMFANDKLYLGYQFDRYDDIFRDMSWVHVVSIDPVNWEEPQPALCPPDDGFGLVFSGCAVVDKLNSAGFGEGAGVGFYTCSDPALQQCMAYSLDGLESWEKHANNPIVPNLDGMPEDFRDPKVFWYPESWQWILKHERFDGEIKLTTLPAENYYALFGSTLFNASVGDNSQVIGPELAVSHVKLSITLEQGANVQFGISNALGDRVLLVYDAAEGEFSLDRTQAGDASFSDKFDCTQKAVIGSHADSDLEIFLDRCSLECFVNAGEYSFTSLLFPSAPYDPVELTGAMASVLRVTEIHSADMHRKGFGESGLQVEPRRANSRAEINDPFRGSKK